MVLKFQQTYACCETFTVESDGATVHVNDDKSHLTLRLIQGTRTLSLKRRFFEVELLEDAKGKDDLFIKSIVHCCC